LANTIAVCDRDKQLRRATIESAGAAAIMRA
jgi:hypothetical protein